MSKTIEVKGKPISIRGNLFEGKVISAKAPKTVTIERSIMQFVSKFERYKKATSKIHAHVPEHLDISEGDIVVVGETRKISKTKSFMVVEKKSDKK